MRALPFSFVLLSLVLVGGGCTTARPSVPVRAPAPAPATAQAPVPAPSAPATTTPPVKGPPVAGTFDVPLRFVVGVRMVFDDRTSLELTAINDSRCKKGVQCIWAGELSPVFTFKDAKGASQEIVLGTTRSTKGYAGGHVIMLNDATTERVTITVSR